MSLCFAGTIYPFICGFSAYLYAYEYYRVSWYVHADGLRSRFKVPPIMISFPFVDLGYIVKWCIQPEISTITTRFTTTGHEFESPAPDSQFLCPYEQSDRHVVPDSHARFHRGRFRLSFDIFRQVEMICPLGRDP